MQHFHENLSNILPEKKNEIMNIRNHRFKLYWIFLSLNKIKNK